MKIKTKINFKESLGNLRNSNLGSSWEKGIFIAVLVSLVIFLAANVYLIFKPIPDDLRAIIDEEINSSNITFDQKTIDSLKERQNPPESETPISGKNPFAPF